MRYEFRLFPVRFRMFDPGERIRPTSPRCPLPAGGEYVVTRCIEPLAPGDESIVFVEGRERGVTTEYLTSASRHGAAPAVPEDGVLALEDMLRAAAAGWDRIRPAVVEAGLDLEGVANRLLAFVEANGLGDELAAYLAAQHRREFSDSGEEA